MSQHTNQSRRRRPAIGCGVSRRSFLADCGMGFAGLAMSAMLEREGIVRAADLPGSGADGAWAPPDGRPHFAPRAKNIIWLFMLGGVSHVEGFDPKPALNQFAGKTIDETPHRDVLSNPLVRGNVREFVANRQIYNTIYPLQVGFAPRGQSGIEVSDWWPHVGSLVDELAVVRSVWGYNDHAAQYEFHTGHHLFDGSHPSVGAWIKYGLGSLNDNLPSFIALGEPPGTCCGGLGSQGASYLGPEHNAVQLTIDPANPLPFSSPGPSVSAAEQRAKFELLRDLHHQHAAAGGVEDPVLAARIKSYELAFRMQMSVPEALGFADETETTRRLYGLDQEPTSAFGQRCLAARRLVERGVRFVQVYHGDGLNSLWDAHTKLRENHSKLCPQVDLPIAGLLLDLKQRGLLDETIVVWGSEFGRTPGAEKSDGRDHHPYGFSVWMAGGGLKRGIVHGATDELGFHAVENRHYITDIHATLLHQLGLDPRRLEVPGRKRLEIDLGQPIREIIA